ncbi:MAG TPA: tetratricopeptide repeat protein [Aliidongia sp.]|nr:tetratricopeptide repeat protein [Aliidongia sp.]
MVLVGALSMCWACTEDPTFRPISSAADQPLSASQRTYQEGKDHLQAGRNGLAIVYFERSLAADPSSVAALNALGVAYDRLHKYAVAQEFYTRALQLDQTSADTWNNMAVSLRLAGAPEAARKFLAEAMKLAPANRTINANKTEFDEPQPGPKAIVTASFSEPASDEEDMARPRLQRAGLREYDLTLPGGAHASFERVGGNILARSLLVDAELTPATLPADPGSVVPLAAPRIKVNVTPLPPPVVQVAALEAAVDPIAPTPSLAPASTTSPHPQIELSNGVGRRGMAARMRAFLEAHGVVVAKIDDARPFNRVTTVVTYQQGWADEATALARLLPHPASIELDQAIGSNIRIVLGRDLSAFDQQMENIHAEAN